MGMGDPERKIRAIIQELPTKEVKDVLKNIFVGESADYYAKEVLKNLVDPMPLKPDLITPVPTHKVIGISMEDCFEMALGIPKDILVVGEKESSDYYLRRHLELAGYVAQIVSQEEFTAELAKMSLPPTNETPSSLKLIAPKIPKSTIKK